MVKYLERRYLTMEYKMYTYCTVNVVPDKQLKWYLKNNHLVPNGVSESHFKSEEALYYWVRQHEYFGRNHKRKGNRILDAIMCSPNDSRRHIKTEDDYSRWRTLDSVYCGYLIKDEKNRIIDLRNYLKEVYSLDVKAYERELREQRKEKWDAEWAERDARWERVKKLYEGKTYWSYYRQIGTTQERRYACDPEHKHYVRGRRSYSNLPNAYDDLYFTREKNWKARVKVSKQWEVNQKRHVDTVKFNKRDYGVLLCEEQDSHMEVWPRGLRRRS